MIENKEIPEEFQNWARANADEKHYYSSDLPDSIIYEAAVANEAYFEGTQDAYRHLSTQPSYPRWVFASERLPIARDSPWTHFQLNGVKVNGNFCNEPEGPGIVFAVHHSLGADYEVKEEDFDKLEWLEEEPNPTHTAQ